ncbi:hypothetical protein EV182_002000 [Spiromyces aspiralis]|uniref:Uncharacterized protein n=1 Tax=Spiromyces aspiralis TaxID=68401 RepID=A0ACC1HSP2_9FUNG|nr:hypothetical protein EV182_002000 [Spiromyces aspiralis]
MRLVLENRQSEKPGGYPEINGLCRAYPALSSAIFQAYIDLAYNQDIKTVPGDLHGHPALIPSSLDGSSGVASTGGGHAQARRIYVPTRTLDVWKMGELAELVNEAQDFNEVVLAIVDDDSTIVYYSLRPGLVPPGP